MMENLKKHEKYMKTIMNLHSPSLSTAETSLRDLAKAVHDIIHQIEEIKTILENMSSTDDDSNAEEKSKR